MISCILLAGGKGTRMGSKVPKQFLPLFGKPLIFYSLDILRAFVDEVVIVCEEEFTPLFSNCLFAKPGPRRQDSLESGFKKVSSSYVLIHDSARPFIPKEQIKPLIDLGIKHGAAALGVPIIPTIKEVKDHEVIKTLDRSLLWEIQTPQILSYELIKRGLKIAKENDLTITDDVGLAELLSHPVKILEGSRKNIKITTPLDWEIAKVLCATS